jgi:hypothetical protein
MGPCNLTMARHLEQVALREEYLRQQRRAGPPSRPATLTSADGLGPALAVSVRIATSPR